MNSIPIDPRFSLRVNSPNSADVWPLKSREFPQIDKRISETFDNYEDDSSCGFTLANMDDLLNILKFYRDCGCNPSFSLGVHFEAGEFAGYAALQEKRQRGISGSFKVIEKSDLSPDEAATKLTAIAHSLQRWQKAHEKGGAE